MNLLAPIQKALSLLSPRGWTYISGGDTFTGHAMNDDLVFQISAVWRAIRVISETISTLPVHVYQETEQGLVIAKGHRYYDKLNSDPNQYLTSPSFYEAIALSMTLWNQAYILAPRVGSRLGSMHVLPKSSVLPLINDDFTVKYAVTINGKKTIYESSEVIPVRGFGKVGELEGMSVPGLHRNAFALAMAAEEYGSKFFRNGGRPSGILEIDKTLTPDQREDMRENVIKPMSGLSNAHKIGLLEAGMKFKAISLPPDSAQLLETRRMQIEEIARIFGVPPSKLMVDHGMKYNNLEQTNLAFLTDTLNVYLVKIEKAFDKHLLTAADRKQGYRVGFDVKGLLRTDRRTKMETIRTARAAAVMTINEAREEIGLPKSNSVGADDLHVPLNMAPLQSLEEIQTGDTNDGN